MLGFDGFAELELLLELALGVEGFVALELLLELGVDGVAALELLLELALGIDGIAALELVLELAADVDGVTALELLLEPALGEDGFTALEPSPASCPIPEPDVSVPLGLVLEIEEVPDFEGAGAVLLVPWLVFTPVPVVVAEAVPFLSVLPATENFESTD